MDLVKKRKPTPEEMEKAVNPELTDATASLCGRTFNILVLPLSKEQVFLKLLRRILPQTVSVSGAAVIDALLGADLPTLCELAAVITANAGEDLTAQDILEQARMVDIVTAIQIQLNENGYLDFLLRMAAVLPAVLNARS